MLFDDWQMACDAPHTLARSLNLYFSSRKVRLLDYSFEFWIINLCLGFWVGFSDFVLGLSF